MIIKVEWRAWKKNPCSSDSPADMHNVYQCEEYGAEIMGWTGSSKDASYPSKVILNLDNGVKQIQLSGGDVAWIMNDSGKTIDTIYTA